MKVVVLDIFKDIEIKPNFWIVSPEQLDTGEIAYTLFIQHKGNNVPDNSLDNVAKMVETKFLENYHYRYCRQLGQLGELRVFSILDNNPEEIYLTTCLKLGQRLGDIKTTVLHPFKQWSSKFQGRFI